MGPGRYRRCAWTRTTPLPSTCRTRSSPGPGCATRKRCARWSRRVRARYAGWSSSARASTPTRPGGAALTREGGHLRDRIAHAGGDATGAEMLARAGRRGVAAGRDRAGGERPGARPAHRRGRCGAGVTLHVMGEGQRGGVGAVLAPAVVLATGGLGQVFARRRTRRSPPATAWPRAAGRRGGRRPGVRAVPPDRAVDRPRRGGQQPLVSEAVRGEGAVLVDDAGERFMAGSTRSPSSRPATSSRRRSCAGCARRGRRTSGWTARTSAGSCGEHRFPTILASCRAHGVDPVTELVPVAPARALRLRGRTYRRPRADHRAGAVRVRGVRLHRGARREPARLELVAGGPGVRGADRGHARRRAAAAREPVPPRLRAGPGHPVPAASCRRR